MLSLASGFTPALLFQCALVPQPVTVSNLGQNLASSPLRSLRCDSFGLCGPFLIVCVHFFPRLALHRSLFSPRLALHRFLFSPRLAWHRSGLFLRQIWLHNDLVTASSRCESQIKCLSSTQLVKHLSQSWLALAHLLPCEPLLALTEVWCVPTRS